MVKTFQRIFSDNNGYKDYSKLLFVDPLAVMVQEFLYTKKAANDDEDYRMDNIPLYDYMTLVVHFIHASTSKFARTTIKDYVNAMKQKCGGGIWGMQGWNQISYTKDDHLLVVNAAPDLVQSVFWSAYIYSITLSLADERWKEQGTLLLSMMKEESCLLEKRFKNTLLMKNTKDAVSFMCKKIQESCEVQEKHEKIKTKDKVEEKEDVSERTRDEEFDRMKELIEDYKNKEKGISIGINQAQAALFGVSLANTLGFSYKNKKEDLAPMLHGLFGWGQARLARCISEPCTKKETEELANLFKDLCPLLYETIMNRGELPPQVTPGVTPENK